MTMYCSFGGSGRDRAWASKAGLVAGGCLAAASLLGCGESERAPASPTVRDSAGVLIVEHGDLSRSVPHWTIVEPAELDVGRTEGPDQEVFGRVTGVTRKRDGGVVVADALAEMVRLFDREGGYLRSTGGRGEGPGEFRFLRKVFRGAGDSIYAYEALSRRLSILDPEGRYVRQVQLPLLSEKSEPTELMGTLESGALVFRAQTTTRPAPGEPGLWPDRETLLFGARIGAELRPVMEYEGWQLVYESFQEMNTLRVPSFASSAQYAVGRDAFAAGNNSVFEIHRFDAAGRLTMILRASREPTPVDVSMRDRQVEWSYESITDPAQKASAEALRRLNRPELPLVESLPAFRELRVDEEDGLWVREYVPEYEERPSLWWVFDADGRFIATASFPLGFDPVAIGEGEVLGIALDEMDVPSVRVHRLAR